MKNLLASLGFVMLVFSVYAQEDVTSPAEGTGEKIGTIIKTAISTALPGVTELVNLFWPKSNPGRVNKDELQQSIAAAKDTLRDELVANFQDKITSVRAVQKEIDILKNFLIPSEVAKLNIALMLERSTSTEIPWPAQQEDWDVVQAGLKDLTNIDVKPIRDLWLRNTLTKIASAQSNIIIRINSAISSKNNARLKEHLTSLNTMVADVSDAVIYQLDNLSSEFNVLADWAEGAAGESGDGESELMVIIKQRLDSRYPE